MKCKTLFQIGEIHDVNKEMEELNIKIKKGFTPLKTLLEADVGFSNAL